MRLRLVVAVVGVMSILAGCAPNPSAPPSHNRPPRSFEPPFVGAAQLPPPDMTDDGPGSLVEVQPLPEMPAFVAAGITGVRVVYRSTSGDGEPSEVSGVVAVPPGKAPKGGWPIISFGHALTGLGEICAPSRAKDLGSYASALTPLLNRGYMVAMSDYQGLGIPGQPEHSALDLGRLGQQHDRRGPSGTPGASGCQRELGRVRRRSGRPGGVGGCRTCSGLRCRTQSRWRRGAFAVCRSVAPGGCR